MSRDRQRAEDLRAEMLDARKQVFEDNPGITTSADVAAALPEHLRDEYWRWNEEY